MYAIKEIPEDFKVDEIIDLNFHENGAFCYFKLKKRDITTQRAVEEIASFLGKKIDHINFAGLKDKKAVTTQYISIRLDETKKNKLLQEKFKNFSLEFVGRGRDAINIGSLKGNKFEITIRKIDFKKLEKIILEKTINYFDEQRFSKNNAEIGKCIITGSIEKAVKLLQLDKNYSQNISLFLEKHKNDFVGALKTLPRRIVLLFLHSYQSLIWNKVVCEYVKIKDPEHAIVKYPWGEFCFGNLKENIRIPIIGFDFDINNIQDVCIKNIYQKILIEEQLNPRDFIIRVLPNLSCAGDSREILAQIKDFKVEYTEDELNPGKKKAVLNFYLKKGCYATIVVRNFILELLKINNL